MQRREKVELAGIVIASCAAAPFMPAAIPAGELSLLCAAVLLGQGLARDLWLKYGAGEGETCAIDLSAGRPIAICAESALGISAVAAGGLLLAAGAGGILHLSPWRWGALFLCLGLSAFALKDLIIDLRARRLRVEKNHRRVVLR